MAIVVDANVTIAWFRSSGSRLADAALDKKLIAAARQAGAAFRPLRR